MLSTRKHVKLFAALLAVVAMAAVVASSAAASVVPGKFSSSTIKLTTTGLTAKHKLESRTCTPELGAFNGEISGNTAVLEGFGQTFYSCSSSSVLEGAGILEATYDTVTGVYSIKFTGSELPLRSPWSWYNPSSFKGTWVNGSGITKSALKLENATIGIAQSSGAAITLTGTFSATTGSGSLLTLSH